MTYTITNNKIRIEPPDGFIVDDFEELIDIDGDGVEELFLVEERPQFFEISVSEDRVNGDLANFHEEGTLSFTGLDTASTTPDDIFAFDFPVLIFDYAEQTAFNIVEGTKRVLSINASPQFPTLFYDDELYLDIFEFNGDGTGTTQHNGIGFNWQVQDDGHLNVAFDNGEVADYFHHTTRPSGDVLSVEYSLVEPWPESDALLVGDTRLSLVRDESDPLPTTRSDVAGIYAGLASIGLGRFEDDLSEISLSLNPDGTGVLQFEYYFENQLITLISQNGACWDVLSNGVIRVNRMHSPDLYFQGSYETTPEFCSGITGEDQIFYRFDLTLMDVVGSTYKMFDQRYDNECGEFPTTNCALEPTHFGIRITDREILTNNPPVLQGEPVAATINSPSVIDVLANDISRDLPIDPSTVEIINSPALGDATVDSTTGVITYTARAAGADFIQYRVRDTAGNLAAVGTVAVSAR